MGTRTIRIDEDVYEKVERRKRDDESFSEAVDRLIEGPPLRELAGITSDEEAAELEREIEEFRSSLDDRAQEVAEEFR